MAKITPKKLYKKDNLRGMPATISLEQKFRYLLDPIIENINWLADKISEETEEIPSYVAGKGIDIKPTAKSVYEVSAQDQIRQALPAKTALAKVVSGPEEEGDYNYYLCDIYEDGLTTDLTEASAQVNILNTIDTELDAGEWFLAWKRDGEDWYSDGSIGAGGTIYTGPLALSITDDTEITIAEGDIILGTTVETFSSDTLEVTETSVVYLDISYDDGYEIDIDSAEDLPAQSSTNYYIGLGLVTVTDEVIASVGQWQYGNHYAAGRVF